jgi:hypothetical protein
MADFLLSYFLTILIEISVLILLLRNDYNVGLIARNVVIASSLTLPFVWFLFPVLGLDWVLQSAAAEMFAFAVEAGLFRILFFGMSWKRAFVASFACNSVSFLFGFFLL